MQWLNSIIPPSALRAPSPGGGRRPNSISWQPGPSPAGTQRHFVLILFILCTLYCMFELFLNRYNMLAIDEFWFAHLIYHYKNALPYRDFAPYKTVLGYYLLLPPMLSAQGVLQTLIFTKQCITILNTFILFGSSLWLTRFFSCTGVITSLILVMSSEIVLSYSTNIRVDLLGYWFCFFGLLFLLEQRFFFAGLLLGIGFITTQKAIWYIFASDIALILLFTIFSRNRKMIWNMAIYNITIAITVAFYIAFWSRIADLHTVMNSIFHEASVLYQLDWYNNARKIFWTDILLGNPLVFALWPITLISILVTFDKDEWYQHRVFVVIVAAVILLCLIPYKMIFPYYMQVTIPILLMLYAAFFTWLYQLFNFQYSIQLIVPSYALWALCMLYLSLIIYIIVELALPTAYLFICIIPLLLFTTITNRNKLKQSLTMFFFNLIFITVIFTGGIYPLSLFYIKTVKFSGDYQQAHIHVINALLQDGSDYVAGIELIYNKTQRIAGLRQLVGPAIDYLANPSAKLRPFMLASLYQDPHATSNSVIATLKNASVKFYVNTYRTAALPRNIKNYLHSHYAHLWGSIYLYAPVVLEGAKTVSLKFSGQYLLETSQSTPILLDGKSYPARSVLYLKKGEHLSSAHTAYRLKLVPESVLFLNPLFQREQLRKIVW